MSGDDKSQDSGGYAPRASTRAGAQDQNQVKTPIDTRRAFGNGVRKLDPGNVRYLGADNPELWNCVSVTGTATPKEVAAFVLEGATWTFFPLRDGAGVMLHGSVFRRADGQFEIEERIAKRVSGLTQFRASTTDRAAKNDKGTTLAITTGGFLDAGITVGKEARSVAERGQAFLQTRLDDMLDHIVDALPDSATVPRGPEYDTNFDGAVFHRELRGRVIAYLRKHPAAFRKLFEPADIEREIAERMPARRQDWFGVRETGEMARFLGDRLAQATQTSLSRLIPRYVTGTLRNPDRRLSSSDVPHHGYLDTLVLNALLDDSHPLTVSPSAARATADRAAARRAERELHARQDHVDLGSLRYKLDRTRSCIDLAQIVSAPWVVPVSTEVRKWTDAHAEHVASMPAAKLRELVPVIEEQYRIVTAAYAGIAALADGAAAPHDRAEAERSAEYPPMLEYALAITTSREATVGDRHLRRAQALAPKVRVAAAETALRESRHATNENPLGKGDRVGNPAEVADVAQKAAEREAHDAGQAVAASQAHEQASGAIAPDVEIAANERAMVFRLRGIVRKLHQLGQLADTVDATDALATLLAVSTPVDAVRVALEQGQAEAARAYKAGGGTDRAAWLQRRQQLVVDAAQKLTAIAQQHDLERAFRKAQAQIEHAQIVQIITQLVVMFALGLASGMAATAIGNLARGMYLARTARGVYVIGELVEVVGGGSYAMARTVGTLATVGTDIAVTSLGQASVTGQSLRSALTQNLISTPLMQIAMKPFAELLGSFKAPDEETARAWAALATRAKLGATAAKGGIAGMEIVAGVAAQYAATKLETAGTAPEPQLLDWLTQGGMTVVGKIVGARLGAVHERLGKLGEAAGKDLYERVHKLRRLAGQLETGAHPERLPELIAGTREIAAAEKDAVARASATGHITHEQAATLESANAALRVSASAERTAKVAWTARGLEPLDASGRRWYGSREQITRAIADGGDAVTLVRDTGTEVHVKLGGEDVQFSVGHARPKQTVTMRADAREAEPRPFVMSPEQAVKRTAADRLEAVTLHGDDTRLVEVARVVAPLDGYVDVVVHADMRSFEVVRARDTVTIDHRALATYLTKRGLAGKKIRLLACEAGRAPHAIAQHLANKLGAEVLAPTDLVWVAPDGTVGVGPRERHHGGWKRVVPSKERVAAIPPPLKPAREHLEAPPGHDIDPVEVTVTPIDRRAKAGAMSGAAHAELEARIGARVVVEDVDDLHVHVVTERRPRVFGYDLVVKEIRVGKRANVDDAHLHHAFVQEVGKFQGVMGLLRRVWQRLIHKGYPPGSRGWVLQHELVKLRQLLEARDASYIAQDLDVSTLRQEREHLESWRDFVEAELAIGTKADLDKISDDVLAMPGLGSGTAAAKAHGYDLPGTDPTKLPAGTHANPDDYYYRQKPGSSTDFELARKPWKPDAPALQARKVGDTVTFVTPEELGPRTLADLRAAGIDPVEELFRPGTSMEKYAAMVVEIVPKSVDDRTPTSRSRPPSSVDAVKQVARDEVQRLSNQDGATVDDVRRKVKRTYERAVLAYMTEPGLTKQQSYVRMRDVVGRLGNADRGSLAEKWYQRSYAPTAKAQVPYEVQRAANPQPVGGDRSVRVEDRTPGPQVGQVERRRADLVHGDELVEVKDIEGPLDRDQFKAYVDVLRDDTVREKLGVERLRYVFTKPEGAVANLSFLVDAYAKHHLRHKLTIEVFDKAGQSHVATTREQLTLILSQIGVR